MISVKMSYTVFIQSGKGKNKATMGSIHLPSKKRVCNYIKRNPLVKSNTKIEVKNLKNNKTIYGTQSQFCNKFRKMEW